jgi:hypothetical protein
VNFSRTYWITFQVRGIVSRVSVIVSPSLARRAPPQQVHAVGPGTMTRSRGRWSGKGLRAGRLRMNGATLVVLAAALSAANSSAVAVPSNSSSSNAIWSSRREARSDLGAYLSRFSFSICSFMWEISAASSARLACSLASSAATASALAKAAITAAFSAATSSGSAERSISMTAIESQNRTFWLCFYVETQDFYPADCGRHVCCGLRQSMASNR